jgi:hypothetical protein
MAKSVIAGIALGRTGLVAATVLSLFASSFAIGEAAAGVGVTSATDGDPLGKPPAEAERVLRIGIDVHANELITTTANDRAHLVFLDGSSLTVGPNARLTIDKFVYDPASKTGELAINASKGVFRMVGGRISKTQPITFTTPSSTIGIRGGIAILDVKPDQTTSIFLFGTNMTVNAGGLSQNVVRPGSQVVTSAGGRPGPPSLVPQGGLSGQLRQLEAGSGGGGQRGGRNADQAAESSGFSAKNSGQAAALGSAPGLLERNPNNNTAIAAITNANATAPSLQPQLQGQPLPMPIGPTPVTGPLSSPLPGPVSAPLPGPVSAPLPGPVSAPLPSPLPVPPSGPSPGPSSGPSYRPPLPPPPTHHHHHHGAMPAVGVGNGGLVPAIPAGGRR